MDIFTGVSSTYIDITTSLPDSNIAANIHTGSEQTWEKQKKSNNKQYIKYINHRLNNTITITITNTTILVLLSLWYQLKVLLNNMKNQNFD